MRELSHLHTAQMRFTARQNTVVIKQVPFAIEFYNGMMVGPANNGFQHHALVCKGPIRIVANGVADKMCIAGRV